MREVGDPEVSAELIDWALSALAQPRQKNF
jgi:hypothetical protein